MIGNDELMRTLRMQSWQRAKGELLAMLATHWSNGDEELYACFNEANDRVRAFIREFEDNALHE